MMNMIGYWYATSSTATYDGFSGVLWPVHLGENWFLPFGILGILLVILWWVLVISIMVAVIRWLIYVIRGDRNRSRFRRDKTALDILNERYARGEINKEEYEQKKKDFS